MANELKIQYWLRDIERLDREISELIAGERNTKAFLMCMEKVRARKAIALNLKEAGIDMPEPPIKGLE